MRILLVQTSFLGDTILSTPVISGIKRIHPTSEIWMMTTPISSDLIRSNSKLSGYLTFDKRNSESGIFGLLRAANKLRKMKFDVVYSLHKSARTSLLLALAKIPRRVGFSESRLSRLYTDRVIRAKNEHDVIRNLSILFPEISPSNLGTALDLVVPEESQRIRTKLQLQDQSYVLVVPGSAWKTKMWHAIGFQETSKYYQSRGIKVVVAGAPNEAEICEYVANSIGAINVCGKTSIGELMSLTQGASLVVCNDSMALHLASAFKVPTVSIFCATSPTFGFGPWANRATVVEKVGLYCKPCRRHGSNICPTGTYECINGVMSTDVIQACLNLFPVESAQC